MDLKKLLGSVPIARKNTPYIAYFLSLLFGPALVFYEIAIEASPVDTELLLLSLFASAFGFVLAFVICRFFFPSRKQIVLALKKADYMFTCISNLSRSQQETIENETQNVLGKIWRSKTYLASATPTYPEFGKHCLYGKVVSNKTFGLNQHVILPYQNIVEVITGKPESKASEAIRSALNALSVAGGAFAAVTGGGVFSFTEKRPAIVVVDDAGNAYQIDCANSDAFLDKLSEELSELQSDM